MSRLWGFMALSAALAILFANVCCLSMPGGLLGKRRLAQPNCCHKAPSDQDGQPAKPTGDKQCKCCKLSPKLQNDTQVQVKHDVAPTGDIALCPNQPVQQTEGGSMWGNDFSAVREPSNSLLRQHCALIL